MIHRGARLVGLAIDTFSGGVVVDIDGVRALMPTEYVGAFGQVHPSSAVGRVVTVEVIAVDDVEDRPPIVSERHVLEAGRKDRAAESTRLSAGERVQATVVKVLSTSVVTDIAGVRGFLDIRDVTVEGDRIITHASQLWCVGEVLDADVVRVDPTNYTCELRAQAPAETRAPTRSYLRAQAVVLIRELIARHGSELSPATLELLTREPRLIGVLAGACATFELAPEHVSKTPSRVETDLAFIAQRLRLGCGFGYALTLVPAADAAVAPSLLLSNVTLLDQVGASRQTLRPLSRFRDVWCGTKFVAGSPARLAAHAIDQAGQAAAEALLEEVNTERWAPPTVVSDSAVAVGLLIDTGEPGRAAAELSATLGAWEANAELFGYESIGIHVFPGGPEEAAITAQVLNSWSHRYPSGRLRISWAPYSDADPDTDPDPAPSTVALRHRAMTTLAGPSLITDVATEPQVCTLSHETLRVLYLADGKMPPGTVPTASSWPLDVLGICAHTAPATVGSPVTTGAQPRWPDDAVQLAWRQLRPNFDGGEESSPKDTVVVDLARGVEVIEQAIYRGPAARVPVQPDVLDGDEISVDVLGALGSAPALLPAALLRRPQVVPRGELRGESPSEVAAGATRLLVEATVSQLAWRWVRAALSESPQTLSAAQVGALVTFDGAKRDEAFRERLWAPRLEETLALLEAGLGVAPEEVRAAMVSSLGTQVCSGEGAAVTIASLSRALAPKVDQVMNSYRRCLIEWS